MADPHHPRDPEPTAGERDDDQTAGEPSRVVVEAIGSALRAHYQAIADIPLPDRFLVLLAELETREQRHDA